MAIKDHHNFLISRINDDRICLDFEGKEIHESTD